MFAPLLLPVYNSPLARLAQLRIRWFVKFYQMTHQARCAFLREQGLLSDSQVTLLAHSTISDIHEVNSRCSENVLGAWPFPFSVVLDFPLPWGHCCVPMVVEETSVVAALNYAAKWVRDTGCVSSSVVGQGVWGQIISTQPLSQQDERKIEQEKNLWVAMLNQGVAARMHARGGGVLDIRVRQGLGRDGSAFSVDYLVDTVDAMGANFINQVGSHLLQVMLQSGCAIRPTAIILSNHQPDFLVEAKVVMTNFPKRVGQAISALANHAWYDKYRAVTHNKGIMNGVDAVLLATGNDWRAVSAAVGAFASESGQYRPLSTWMCEGDDLVGSITLPVPCATVGGVTGMHPMAQLAMGLLGYPNKNALMQIVALVGLLQNFSALRALADEGITQGHMRLHIPNFIMSLGVEEQYRQLLTQQAEAELRKQGTISQSDVARLYEILCQEEAATRA